MFTLPFARSGLINVSLLLLCVGNGLTVTTLEKEIEAEKQINITKNQYLQMMAMKPDWLKRILEIVKIELTLRHKMKKGCVTETCLYEIEYRSPSKASRWKRSLQKKKTMMIPQIRPKEEKKKTMMIPQIRFKEQKKKMMMIPQTKHKEEKKQKPSAVATRSTTQRPTIQTSTQLSDEHMKDCQGQFVEYCTNGAKCLYIDLLGEAICICRKGFTGKRCVNFSLSDTVQILRSHEKEQVNISSLNVKETELLDSVMDATVRFTYDAYEKESESVKEILDYSMSKDEA